MFKQSFHMKLTSSPEGDWKCKCKLPAILGYYDGPTSQPSVQPKDQPINRRA